MSSCPQKSFSQVATSLPRQFVVPAHVTDDKLVAFHSISHFSVQQKKQPLQLFLLENARKWFVKLGGSCWSGTGHSSSCLGSCSSYLTHQLHRIFRFQVWGTKAGGNLYLQPQSNVLVSDEVSPQPSNICPHSFDTYLGEATVQGLLPQRQNWGARYRRLGRPISSKVSTSW